jgi:hypothetical protein
LSDIAHDRFRNLNSKSAAIVAKALQPFGFAINRINRTPILHQHGKVCGFPAWRRTSIEYDVSRLGIDQWRNQLRSFVFDIKRTFLKPRQ